MLSLNEFSKSLRFTLNCFFFFFVPPLMLLVFFLTFQPSRGQSVPRDGERRRGALGVSRAQRRIKASSTPALLDRDEM